MAGRLITILELTGVLALVAAVLAVVAGLLVAIGGIGATGLGAFILPAGLILAAFGVVGLLPATAFLKAARALRETEPELPPTTPGGRLVSTVIAVVAAVAAVAPTVVWFAFTGSVNVLAAATLLVGGACVVAAWSARYLLHRGLGVALLGIALIGAGIGAAQASSIARDQSYRQAATNEQARRDALYAPIAGGPTAGQIAAAVPSVGSWRALTGWVFPELQTDEFPYGPRDLLAEFRGLRVRLALVGQCWIDAAGGQLEIRAWVAQGATPAGEGGERRQLDLTPIPCDGAIHAVTSDPIDIPDWLETAAPFGQREAWLTVNGGAVPASQAGGGHRDQAGRWLLYVSAEPGTSLDDLRAAVAAQVPLLVLSPSP